MDERDARQKKRAKASLELNLFVDGHTDDNGDL